MRSSDDRLRGLILKYEGLRLKPYYCTEGKLTIAYGRNLEAVGIYEDEANLMRENDIKRANRDAVASFGWFKSLNMPRQDVILLMIVQMGTEGVKKFAKMCEAIRCGNFDKAAAEMLDSKWYQQTPVRAKELSEMMRTGRYL